MKKIRNILLLIFCMSFVSSLAIGISPEKIILNGKTNEDICGNFNLIGEESIYLGNVSWSKINSKNLEDYYLDAEELNLEVGYPLQTSVGTKEICVKSKSPGKFYGALVYQLDKTSYGVGTWIELNVEGESIMKKISLMTGNVTYEKINLENISLGIILSLLLVILILMIKKL